MHDEAFVHPAKFARALIRHIYAHAVEEGWLKEGDAVLDPFGGVALGALDAMSHGLHWVGVELEERFVDLGTDNITLWNHLHNGVMPRWGSAVLLQGDSRRLVEVVEYLDFEAVVSSPPYAGSLERSGGIDAGKSEHVGGPHSQMNRSDTRYGAADGQLGAMPEGAFDGAVSSPPYEGSLHRTEGEAVCSLVTEKAQPMSYSPSPDNLGNDRTGDTFWSAARQVVEQVHQVVKPGGVAIWVVKDFVRKKKRVPFSEMWREMCEACGFELLHHHRAWLIEDRGTQLDLWGNGHHKVVKRASFFRRLYEKKYPENAIDWESVLCMRCQAKINSPGVQSTVKRLLAYSAEIKADPDQYAALLVRHDVLMDEWREKLQAAALAAQHEQVRGMIHEWWERAG